MYSVFVGHPFKKLPFEITAYRGAISTAFHNIANPTYADDAVGGEHILAKIVRQIDEAQLCLFDVTGDNPNVSLELGVAIGLGKEYRLLLHTSERASAQNLITDLAGWDRLQYSTLPELTTLLAGKVIGQFKPRTRLSKQSQELNTAILPFIHVDYRFRDDDTIAGSIKNVGSGAAIELAAKLPGFDEILLDRPLLVNTEAPFKLRTDDIRILEDSPSNLRALIEYKDKSGTKYRQTSSVIYPYNAKGRFMDYLLRPFDTPEVVESFELSHRWF